jgi:hypothetical protein
MRLALIALLVLIGGSTRADETPAGKTNAGQTQAAPTIVVNPPVTGPIAAFLRHNGGWSVTVSFPDPVIAIAWRLRNDGPFKDTGFLDTIDPQTRRRMANPTFELDADTPASELDVRGMDAGGGTVGPYAIAFDPVVQLERSERGEIEMTAGSWVSFRQYNGLLLYYTQLMSYRCAIREIRLGIDSPEPTQVLPLPPCDPRHPEEIPSDAKGYLYLPPSTQTVSVQLTYRDGGVSETKTFKNDTLR